MEYVKSFLIGGLLCAIAQILFDKTNLLFGRILVIYVCLGCFLGGLGIYRHLVDFAGMGAVVPLTGWGYSLSQGVIKEVDEQGLLGVFSGGLKSAAAGLSVAILSGFLLAILSPKANKRL